MANERGLTLIEVIIAVFVLAVAVLALASVAVTSLASVRISRDRDQATSAASAALEAARTLAYENLAMNDADSPPATFSHDGSTSEPTIVTSDGAVSPFQCAPADPSSCWFSYAPYAERHTVSTYVTWFDDPTLPGNRDGKRVTTVVSWEDPGAEPTRELRQSTIVAESRRGLGQPDFTISDPNQSLIVPEDADACFRHLLNNFGPDDGFEFTVEERTAVNSLSIRVTNNSDNKSWNTRGWLGPPPTPSDEVKAWRDGAAEPTSTQMRLGESTDPEWLGSPLQVAKDDTAELIFCYRPVDDINGPKTHTFNVRVRSKFAAIVDPSTPGQSLSHTITIDNTSVGAFLTENFEIDPEVTSPPDRLLPDYDGDGIPGLGLNKPAVTGEDGEISTPWTTTKLTGASMSGATLVLHTSWKDAIEFGSTQQKDISVRVRLCVDKPTGDGGADSCLDTADPSQYTASVTTTHSYSHSTAGWSRREIALSFPEGQITVPDGEHMRLQVTCMSPTSDKGVDCHFAYDTADLGSRLVFE